MLRKLTALLLIISMLTIPVMAQEKEDVYDEYARNLLIGLSVMTENELAPSDASDFVTRAELARVLVRLSGNDVSIAAENPFKDVASDHPDYAYIYYASLLGFMSGDGAGKFRPDDYITTEEATAAFIRLLGYNGVVGAYPEGHYNMAVRLGLFVGATIERGKNISKADLVRLTENALNVDLMIQTDYTDGGAYEILKNETILTYNLYIRKGKGIIDKNHIAGLTVTSGVGDGRVCIDGTEFLAGKTNAAELLGYRVEYYYRESAGERELLYIDSKSFNDILVIDSEDIENLSGNVLTYTDDRGKIEKLTLSSRADLLYNGVPVPFAYENIKITDGGITLIDNNRDGIYDVISVEKYITLVVERVDSINGIIYSKYKTGAQNFTYDMNDVGKEIFFYDRKGVLCDPSTITEWDVVSIKQDKEKKRTFVYTTVTEIKGTVSQTSVDDDYKICVNDKWYKVADYIKSEAQLGDRRFFYLDLKGKIVAAREPEASEYFWAYVHNGATEGAISSKYVLQIFEESGNVVVRDVAKNLKIDATPYKTVSTQKTACEALFGEVVKVKLNDLGEIREIMTTRGGAFSKKDLRNAEYIKESQIFGGQAALNDDTVTFRIPNSGNTDKFVVTLGEKEYDDESAYSYSVYVAGDSIEADAILCKYNDSTPINNSLPVYMVDRTNYVRDADGNYVVKLHCYYRSKPVNFELKDESVLNSVKPQGTRIPAVQGSIKLEKGDLIRVGTAYDGIVDRIEIYYDASEDILYVPTGMSETPWTTSTDYAGSNRLTQGYIYSIDGNSFILAATNGVPSAAESAVQEIHSWKNTTVTVYDSVEDEVRAGSKYDAYSYKEAGSNATRAIVFTRKGEPHSILLYR